MSINRVNITGNLTRDCEVRELQSGSYALEFGVAVSDRRKNQATGEWEDVPNYVNVTEFASSERLMRWHQRELRKGAKVAIDGRLRYSSWETKDGQRRNKLDVVANSIEFMAARGDGEAQDHVPANMRKDPPRRGGAPSADAYDDDMPF